MLAVLYTFIFCGKKYAFWASQHRNLHLKTTGLFSSEIRWTCILPHPTALSNVEPEFVAECDAGE